MFVTTLSVRYVTNRYVGTERRIGIRGIIEGLGEHARKILKTQGRHSATLLLSLQCGLEVVFDPSAMLTRLRDHSASFR